MAGTIHSENYRALVATLRELREQAGLSQAELAVRLGRPQSWVSKVETGERRIDVEELRQVAVALELDPLRVVRTWLARLPTTS